MTGIWNFSPARAAAIAAMFVLPASAADISLSNGSKLTGDLLAMDGEGTITLESPNSDSPLMLVGEMVSYVGFTSTAATADLPGQRVELINGDILPVSIRKLDDQAMTVMSPDMGELRIPRSLLSSVQLGVFEERLVYAGGEDLSGWKDKGNAESWTPANGRLVAQNSGTLTREVKLPEKFVIRFTLQWSQQPNFRLTFADPNPKRTNKVDRYYFDVNGSNISILRDSKNLRSAKPIMILGRSANRFRANLVDVEIRGDLSRGLLHLYLNGELEGRFTDPYPEGIPAGSGLSITNRAPESSQQMISNIEIAEWDERSDRHRGEDRGDGSSDAIIGKYGERFGGKLTSISEEGGMRIYEFKSDFQKEPLRVPESEVSTVFFAGDMTYPENESGLMLRLRGSGMLTLGSCIFGEDMVEAKHPLLGEIQVKRDGITALEKRIIPKAQPIEE